MQSLEAVDAVLNHQVRQIMETNQKVVESLLHIVILCGKQELALCDHRDDRIDWQAGERSNEGNFVQLICFRAYLSKLQRMPNIPQKQSKMSC